MRLRAASSQAAYQAGFPAGSDPQVNERCTGRRLLCLQSQCTAVQQNVEEHFAEDRSMSLAIFPSPRFCSQVPVGMRIGLGAKGRDSIDAQ